MVYVLHLQDMKIGEEVITQEAWTGPSGEYMPSTEWVNTQLSLQGYNGSPEQQALREWLDFKEQYDPDGTLMKENNMNESGVPEQYYITYDCYTFEMMDKLNEILDKYHLNALGTWTMKYQNSSLPRFRTVSTYIHIINVTINSMFILCSVSFSHSNFIIRGFTSSFFCTQTLRLLQVPSP